MRQGKLIGVGLIDMTPRVQSSIYFIHDPSWRPSAPGTFSILSEIQHGQASGRDHMYLGYYIRECESMSYKNRYTPHEFLRKYVPDVEVPVWQSPTESDYP